MSEMRAVGEMRELHCPACGSESLERKVIIKRINEPFSEDAEVELSVFKCQACGTEGDFFNNNDVILSNAIDASKNRSVQNILEKFSVHNISMASIERALDLPQRTLIKWKSGKSKPSAAGVALLRMVCTFPWLLEVADNNYEYDFSQKICVTNAVSTLLNNIHFEPNYIREGGVITSPSSVFMFMHFFHKADENATRVLDSKTAPEAAITETTLRLG